MTPPIASDYCLGGRRAFVKGLAAAGLGSLLPFAGSDAARAAVAGPSTLQDFANVITGPVVIRGQPEYEPWRQSMVWQRLKPDRHPAVIVRPTSVDEVCVALRFARRSGLKVAVRTGGGQGSANFLHDGGMLLDMWNFHGLEVNRDDRTAWAGPAVRSYQLEQALSELGMAFPIIHCACVPLGGYLLGGGFGFNGNAWGHAACFSILGADVVTADGEPRRVTPEKDPDLYWALRGGGLGFPGVVTRYKLRLYPLPRCIATGQYVFPMQHIGDVSDWLTDFVAGDLRDRTEVRLDSDTRVCSVLAIVYGDSEAEARSVLERLAKHPMAQKAAHRTAFHSTDLRTLLMGAPGRHQTYGLERKAGESIWTDRTREVLGRLKKWTPGGPPAWKPSFYVTYSSPRRNPLPDAAFSVMDETLVGFVAGWDDGANDAVNIARVRRVEAEILRPYATGFHVNFINAHGDPEKIRGSFSPQAWNRLQAIRRTRDPQSVFHDYLGVGS